MSCSAIEGGDNVSVSNTANNSQVYSDNISFNSSSISAYSAEEQIIQERSRRSPKKKRFDDLHELDQLQYQSQASQQLTNGADSFLKLKETSMRSPDEKSIKFTPEKYASDIIGCTSFNSSISSSTGRPIRGKRNLNKTLLRTPVKRRLRLRRDSGGFSINKKLRRRC